LGAGLREIAARRHFALEVHCLPPLLHNGPTLIAPAVEQMVRNLQATGLAVAVAYADCGSYGALDAVCERLMVPRLAGLHCYEVIAGAPLTILPVGTAGLESEPESLVNAASSS
jgi:hypothetical protein